MSMPINMTDYKMIYHDMVYNVLQICINFLVKEGTAPKLKFIDAVYVDEDGMIKVISDEAWCFQFVRRKVKSDGET